MQAVVGSSPDAICACGVIDVHKTRVASSIARACIGNLSVAISTADSTAVIINTTPSDSVAQNKRTIRIVNRAACISHIIGNSAIGEREVCTVIIVANTHARTAIISY